MSENHFTYFQPQINVQRQYQHQCKMCGAIEGLRRCSRCQEAYYCSQDHQRIDWKQHKLECRSIHQPILPSETFSNSSPNSILVGDNKNNASVRAEFLSTNHTTGAPINVNTQPILTNEEIEKEMSKIFLPESSIGVEELLDLDQMDVDHILNENNFLNNINNINNFEDSGSQNNKLANMQLTQTVLQPLPSASDLLSSDLNLTDLLRLQAQSDIEDDYNEQCGLDDMSRNLIRDMNEYGVCVIDNFLGQDRGLNVLQEFTNLYTSGVFKDGQLVSNKGKRDLRHIRGDKIAWIDGKEPECSNIAYLINQVDSVVSKAMRMKNNGKLGSYNIRERTKAMVACYPGAGSHYIKHIDNPNQDGRCITAIYYLNRNWDVRQSGGLLRIFPEEHADRVADIEPIFDRILFFWSDRRNPHEVQPAHRTRYAITLWYLDVAERESARLRYQRDCEGKLKT